VFSLRADPGTARGVDDVDAGGQDQRGHQRANQFRFDCRRLPQLDRHVYDDPNYADDQDPAASTAAARSPERTL
jgi:hypothetical protein